MRQYDVVSADSHLEVSPDQWRGFVDREFHDWVPRIVDGPRGGQAWLMPGSEQLVPLGLQFAAGRRREDYRPEGLSYAEGLTGTGNAAQRLRELDQDEVDAAVLFPAIQGQRSLGDLPREAYVAVARGYNDWLSSEYCAADYDRLLGAAILPVTTIEDAIAELERVASLPGLRTVVLHGWPNGSGGPDPDVDDRFWRRAIELDMPLSAHGAFGGGQAADVLGSRPGGGVGINYHMTRNGHYTATQIITSGLLDRLSDLRFYFAETGIGWLPYYAEQADDNYHRHRFWAGLELPNEPSWYIRRHFSWGFQVDRAGLRMRDLIGVENLMWADDFPHVATDWPHSREVIKREFEGIPDDEVRLMICDNAVKYFHLDRA